MLNLFCRMHHPRCTANRRYQRQQQRQESNNNHLRIAEGCTVQDTAEAALRDKNPCLFSNGTPKRSGVVYRTMFDAELRRLIDERTADMTRSTGSTADAADRAGEV